MLVVLRPLRVLALQIREWRIRRKMRRITRSRQNGYGYQARPPKKSW